MKTEHPYDTIQRRVWIVQAICAAVICLQLLFADSAHAWQEKVCHAVVREADRMKTMAEVVPMETWLNKLKTEKKWSAEERKIKEHFIFWTFNNKWQSDQTFEMAAYLECKLFLATTPKK